MYRTHGTKGLIAFELTIHIENEETSPKIVS